MIGKSIAHYYILEEIGTGGLAVLYKARDLKLDRLVMLKAIEIPDNDADAFASFQKEARAGVSLNHPNISSLLDVIDEKDGRYLIYEYLPGSSLREKLERAKASGELLPIDRSLDYILAVAHGLADAHRHGIVHRDICPENVIVTPTHSVKITNFGKARLGDGPSFAMGGKALSSAFSAFVPEQLQGAAVDHRCDIYCLAALLFELLTGEPAFKAKNPAARLNEIIYNPVPNMLDMRPGISNGLQRIVERGMAKKPDDRFPTWTLFSWTSAPRSTKGSSRTKPCPPNPPSPFSPSRPSPSTPPSPNSAMASPKRSTTSYSPSKASGSPPPPPPPASAAVPTTSASWLPPERQSPPRRLRARRRRPGPPDPQAHRCRHRLPGLV